MAITSAERTKILQLIVGMFNAAPGELYLNQIASAYEADGHNLLTLAKQLSTTGAFQSIYPAFMTGSDFATAFLTPLGLEDVPSVFNWIKGRYESGENKGTIIFDAMAALVGSTSADPNVVEAQAILANKVEVAEYYSVTKGLSDPDLADLQLVLAGVDATDASVDAAIAVIDGVASAGQTFTLLHTQDHVVGTELNDTINGIVDGEFNVDNTFTLGDSIEGNGGFDIFNILTDQVNVNFLGKTVTEVEAFNLDVVNGEDFDLLNLNNVAFETAVANFNNATELDGMTIDNVNNATALTVENVDLTGERVDVNFTGGSGFDGVVNITNVTDGNFFIATNQGATAAGELTLNLDGADDLYIAPGEDTAGVLTLNVNVNGDSSGVQISNYSGFADDSAAVVNLVLNADLEAVWWDLPDNDEGTTTTFNISGAGNLTIDELDDGSSELTIAGGTATGDLDISVFNSTMVAATTGSGDDRIAVSIDQDYFIEEGSAPDIDLGAGANTIALNEDEGVFGSFDIGNITFDDGTVLNAQTLELNGNVSLNEGSAELDISGLGAGLAAVHVTGNIDGLDNTLSFPAVVEDDPDTEDTDESQGGSPATLALNADGFINDLTLDTGDVTNMSVSAVGELDLDAVVSETLQTLTLDDAEPDEGSAVVWLDLDGSEGNLAELTTLTVNGDDYVNIGITGEAGDDAIPASAGTLESGSFAFSAFASKGTLDNKQFNGTVLITGADLPGGQLLVDVTKANNATDVAHTVALALDGVTGVTASNTTTTVNFNWDAVGNKSDLAVSFIATDPGDTVTASAPVITQGTPATAAIPATNGSGFEALADVNVDAGGSADVSMTDAYGNFTADITAGGNAIVTLTNTGVTSLTVDSGDYAWATVTNAADLGPVAVSGMDTVVWLDNTSATSIVAVGDATEDDTGSVWVDVWDGNDDLASITATAWTANIDLFDSLESLATLDLSGVVDAADVDATGADFGTGLTVKLGAEDLVYATDDTNAVRETFEFDGADTGAVSIDGFFQSVGGTGDRIDFSHMTGTGINSIDDLSIVFSGGNTVITSLVDGVDVDITVVGADLSQDAFYFVF